MMQETTLRCRRILNLMLVVLGIVFFMHAAHAQTLMLEQLPYRDPRALDSLLSLNESAFATQITTAWPQTEATLSRYIPPGVTIDQPSFFFSSTFTLCLNAHQPAACRVYIDFLSFLMKSKQPAARVPAEPPVLMRPAQLAWRDTAILNALLLLDSAQLQSALKDHWPWIRNIVVRYLPDNVELYPISKIFGSVRTTCNTEHSEAACREFLFQLDTLVDNNRGQPRTELLTLSQVAYRNPAPLTSLLRLNEAQLRSRLATNWPQIDSLLNQYINWNVALVGDTDFARSRLDCQAAFTGDYFLCRRYFSNLSALMRSKQPKPGQGTLTNPFGQ